MTTNSYKGVLNRIPTNIEQTNEEIVITFLDGTSACWYHEQECCEMVEIEDVNGDWNDLIGSALVVCDERISHESDESNFDSNTWTFYTFRSNKGSVDVRWHGSSNGYYSESVNYKFTKK